MPEFTVNADATITLDGRYATSAVSVTTPRAGVAAIDRSGSAATTRLGGRASFSSCGGVTNYFFVQPTTTRSQSANSLLLLHAHVLAGRRGDAVLLRPGVPERRRDRRDQHYVVHAADLARSTRSTRQAVRGRRSIRGSARCHGSSSCSRPTCSSRRPTQRTEYYSALPSINWQGAYFSVFTPDPFLLLGAYRERLAHIHAWRELRDDVVRCARASAAARRRHLRQRDGLPCVHQRSASRSARLPVRRQLARALRLHGRSRCPG